MTRFQASLATLAAALAVGPARGADDYAKTTAAAQQAIGEGRAAEARRLLAATAPGDRGYEFDYLQARLAAPPGPKGVAPDLIRTVKKPEVDTRYAVLHPFDRQVVSLCRDGTLRVYDLMRPDQPPAVHRHPGGEAVWSGAFSDGGTRFVSGHQNGDVLVWDARAWTVLHTIRLSGKPPVRQLAVSPRGTEVVAEGEKELELWSLEGPEPRKVGGVGPRFNFGEGLAVSPKGDVVATGGMFEINVHDIKTGKLLRSMRHASYTMGLRFSSDATKIASAPRGNVNRFLGMFDAETGRLLYNKGPFGQYVVGLAFTPDGKRLAATGCENLLRLFDTRTGEVVLTIPRPNCGSEPGFSAAGRLLGWSEPDGFHYVELDPVAAPGPGGAAPGPRPTP